MDIKEIQLQRLAYQLADKLNHTTRQFIHEYRTTESRCVFGAANLYMAGLFVNFPTKEKAFEVLEKNFDKIREILNATPDEAFVGRRPEPKEENIS